MKELVDREKQITKEEKEVLHNRSNTNSGFAAVDSFKPANEQLHEIVDAGMCLSMHQPYASLLIAGIKRCL